MKKEQTELPFLNKKIEVKPKGKATKKQLSREDSSFILKLNNEDKEINIGNTKPE
ncbi:MAG: hypothetical protein LC127_12380 [Chitinophagales bacterium]|nr:hypothetical protein [Chitinophagales bacterium]